MVLSIIILINFIIIKILRRFLAVLETLEYPYFFNFNFQFQFSIFRKFKFLFKTQ